MSDELPIGTPLEQVCPQCGHDMVLRRRRADGHLFYGCTAFPACSATHGAHADGRPLGVPADRDTRLARIDAHSAFDELWRGKEAFMSRSGAYAWMAVVLGLPVEEAHIGHLDEAQCRRLIELVEEEIEREVRR